MSFLFFRCRFCGWTQPTVNPSEEDFERWLSCCPACDSEHPNYQDYLDAKDREQDDLEKAKTFGNGDAVVAYDGDDEITGVVVEIYEDTIEVDYFDMETMTTETMDFHVSNVEHA